MSEEEMTRRLIRVMENPHVTMLGHPTGRLLLAREGYPVNMAEIIEAAARTQTIIEINASPYRLDLDWRWCKPAKELGVLLSINPDAHAVEEMDNVIFGVHVARKGWLTPADVVNTRSLAEVEKVLKRKRYTNK
jgi:DNA polymerase (family 10)